MFFEHALETTRKESILADICPIGQAVNQRLGIAVYLSAVPMILGAHKMDAMLNIIK
jgi:hypothetical protein